MHFHFIDPERTITCTNIDVELDDDIFSICSTTLMIYRSVTNEDFVVNRIAFQNDVDVQRGYHRTRDGNGLLVSIWF